MLINFLATNNYKLQFEDLLKDDTIDKIKTRIFREHSEHLPMPSSVLLQEEENDDTTDKMIVDNIKPCILHPFQIRLLYKGRQLMNFSTLGEIEGLKEEDTFIIAISPFTSLKTELEKNSMMLDNASKEVNQHITTDELVVAQPLLNNSGVPQFILAVNDKGSFESESFSKLDILSDKEKSILLSRIPPISSLNNNNNTTTNSTVELKQSKNKFKVVKQQDINSIETVMDRLTLEKKPTIERIEVIKPELQVVSFIGAGRVSSCFGVTIVFNRPFIPLSSDISKQIVPFSITPEIPNASWKWIDGITCKYTLPGQVAFPHSTRYEVNSKPEIFERQYGEIFPEKSWEIITSPQFIVQPFYNSSLENPEFAIVFSQKLPESFTNRDSKYLEKFFSFTLNFMYQLDHYIIQESKDPKTQEILNEYQPKNQVLAFRINCKDKKHQIDFDSEIELKTEAGIPSSEGPLKTDKAFSNIFRAPLSLTAFANDKKNEYSTASEVSFFASSPCIKQIDIKTMTEEEIEEYCSITPKVKITDIKTMNNTISILADFSFEKSYSVVIQNFRDNYGQRLQKTTGDFTFPKERAEITLTDGYAFGSAHEGFNLDPLSKPIFQIKTKGCKTVNLKVYKIPKIFNFELFNLNQNTLNKAKLTLLENSSIEINHQPKNFVNTKIDLCKYFGSSDSQSTQNSLLYFVISTPQDDKIQVHKILQFSPLVINAITQGSDVLAWVNNVQTGEKIMKGSIKTVSGEYYKSIEINSGIAKTTDEEFKFLYYEEDGRQTVLPFVSLGPKLTQSSIKWSTFDDCGLYKPGDTVNIKGLIRVINPLTTLELELPKKKFPLETSVKYKLTDPRRVEKLTGSVEIDDLGCFVIKMVLPLDCNLGEMSVSLTYHGSTSIHTFKLEEFKRKQFLVESKIAHKATGHIMENEMFSVEAFAKSYTDEIMSNTMVEWEVSASGFKPSFLTLPNGFDFNTDFNTDYFGPWKFIGKRMLSGRHKMDFVLQDMKSCCNVTVRGIIKDVTNVSENFQHNFSIYSKQLLLGIGKNLKRFINLDETFSVDLILSDTLGNSSDKGLIKVSIKRVPWEEDLPLQNIVDRDIVPSSESFTKFEHKFEHTGYHKLEISFENPSDFGSLPQIQKYDIFVLGKQTDVEKEYKEIKPISTLKPAKALSAKKPLIDLAIGFEDSSKRSYEVNDTYKLIITSSKLPSGKGYLFISNNRKLISFHPISLENGSAVFESVVRSEDFPTIIFSVYLQGSVKLNVNSQDVTRLTSQFAENIATLSVDHKKLEVSIIDFKKFQVPNEKSKISVQVKNKKSQELIKDADVTLVIVDEALTDISGKSTSRWSPLDLYRQQRELSIRSSLLDLTSFQDPQLIEDIPNQPVVPVSNQITIRYLSGRVLMFNIDNSIGIEELRNMIQERDGLPPSYQRLFYLNKPIQEDGVKKTLRSLGVPNGAIINLSIRLSGGSGAGVGIDDKPDPSVPPKIIRVRDNFNALACFESGRTDKDGKVTFECTLPDNLTSYKIMAYALNTDSFGASEDSFTSTLPVMIRQSPPRFLNYNDECLFPIAVQSIVNFDMDVQFAITSTTCQIKTNGYKSHLPAGQRITIPVEIKALVPNKVTTFQCAVTTLTKDGESFSDAIKFEFPVHSPSSTESVTINHALDSKNNWEYFSHELQLSNWSEIDQQVGNMTINLSNSPLSKLKDGLDGLLDYEYACSEQLASKLLALGILIKHPELYQSLDNVRSDAEKDKLKDTANVKKSMLKMIEKLSTRYNTKDGTFKYWDGADSKSYLFVNLYCHWVLTQLHSKFGIEEAKFAKAQGVNYVRDVINSYSDSRHKKEKKQVLLDTAFACFVFRSFSILNSCGSHPKKCLAMAVKEHPKSYMDVLAAIIPLVGDSKEYKSMVNCITVTGSQAYFSDISNHGGFISQVRTTALAVINLTIFEPNHPLLSKLVAGLSQRKFSYNTQDNAFSLFAIYQYHSTKVAPVRANVYLNDFIIGNGDIDLNETKKDHQMILPINTLIKNQGNLFIEKHGNGQLFYNIQLNYALLNPYYKEISDRGFKITRTYIGCSDASDVQYQSDGSVHIKGGSKVKVELKIKVDLESSFVVIRDCLPAGLEPTRTNYRHYWMDHLNVRDKGCEVFADSLYPGNFTFSYTVVALSRGKYISPPAKIEEMYCPTTFGRSQTETIIIN